MHDDIPSPLPAVDSFTTPPIFLFRDFRVSGGRPDFFLFSFFFFGGGSEERVLFFLRLASHDVSPCCSSRPVFKGFSVWRPTTTTQSQPHEAEHQPLVSSPKTSSFVSPKEHAARAFLEVSFFLPHVHVAKENPRDIPRLRSLKTPHFV